jgi:NitT/TauT family transport system substrate-binding protein
MKLRKILPSGLTAIACLLALLLGCSQPIAPPFRVGTVTWIGFEPLYLAQDLGYFGKQPIQIINYPSSTEISRAYRNRELEGATPTLDEALLMRQADADVNAFLILDFSHGADVLLGKPQIKDLQSLKGKRVGVEATALGSYILSRALDQAKLTPKDITVVSLGYSEQEAAFKQDQIDAVVTFGPTRSNLLATGAHVLFDSSVIPNEIIDLLVTRKTMLDQYPDTLKALVKGWSQGLEYLQSNPEDAIRRIAARQNLKPEEVRDTLKLIRIPTLLENQKFLSKTDPAVLHAAKKLSEVMVSHKLLKQPIDPEPMFTPGIVQSLN